MKFEFDSFWSPEDEMSVFKGIPISLYTPDTMAKIRKVAGPVRVKFRGPRPAGRTPSQRRATCLRKDAVTFSVYFNFKY